jgi:hypothetical protein
VDKKAEIINPILHKINVVLCGRYFCKIQKTTLPKVFPTKIKTPINPILNLSHSIPNSLTQLYLNLLTIVYLYEHFSLDKASFS